MLSVSKKFTLDKVIDTGLFVVLPELPKAEDETKTGHYKCLTQPWAEVARVQRWSLVMSCR